MSEQFKPIGEKVENVAPTTAMTNGENAPPAEDDQKAVEEIESLCMNCHENVSATSSGPDAPTDTDVPP